MPRKTKPIKTTSKLDVLKLMTTARDMGATTFKCGELEVHFAPVQQIIAPPSVPLELQPPHPDDITKFTTQLAISDMERLGFAPNMKKKKFNNFQEALSDAQAKEQEGLDEGLFVNREQRDWGLQEKLNLKEKLNVKI